MPPTGPAQWQRGDRGVRAHPLGRFQRGAEPFFGPLVQALSGKGLALSAQDTPSAQDPPAAQAGPWGGRIPGASRPGYTIHPLPSTESPS